MPKRSNQHVVAVAVPAVSTVDAEDGEKKFSLPVQLTKKQCIESFVEVVNESADDDGMYWYKHATCAISLEAVLEMARSTAGSAVDADAPLMEAGAFRGAQQCRRRVRGSDGALLRSAAL